MAVSGYLGLRMMVVASSTVWRAVAPVTRSALAVQSIVSSVEHVGQLTCLRDAAIQSNKLYRTHVHKKSPSKGLNWRAIYEEKWRCRLNLSHSPMICQGHLPRIVLWSRRPKQSSGFRDRIGTPEEVGKRLGTELAEWS
ncbi:hypothetical protein F2Q69_00047712 [Brassica cretica]|uniref:Uncharacterized protein n=1 Tax=Brassica cretica TaxID=69181 RepID=A0A8S9Q250_BRACR|nr:hypothetical protein F2Q69_00047712 [Brassica cretica]